MKIIPTIIPIIMLLLIGCQTKEQKITVLKSFDNTNYKIIEIDSCEYIPFRTNLYNQTNTHKGNCKFCTKRRKVERNKDREIIIKILLEDERFKHLRNKQ